jgi:hypothetical protein
MKTTIGRIVIYTPTDEQKEKMESSFSNTGKSCNVQSKLPAVIVAAWNDTCVNLKVLLDGDPSDLWITSAHQGDEPGQWNWPVIES